MCLNVPKCVNFSKEYVMNIDLKLTTEEEKKCVELFAQGYSRSEVASYLIENSEGVEDIVFEHGEENVRKHLRFKLRLLDPSDMKFAVTKHGEHYKTHLTALKEAISEHYEKALINSMNMLSNYINDLDDRADELRRMLDASMEVTPVGAGEHISTQNALLNIEKRKLEVHSMLIERFERIHQQTA